MIFALSKMRWIF